MNDSTNLLLVLENEDGTKGYINLIQAIADGRLIVKVSPRNRAYVLDVCTDCPENRHDIDTNIGTNEVMQS